MSTHTVFSSLRKHRVFLLIATFFAWTFLLWFESAFAVTELPPEDVEKVVTLLNGIITGAAAIMWMVTWFITMFLYPGWVNGTLFGLQEYLKIMWILVSNMVYFIFAFILIAIAFMNIIGKWEGTWELKQAMPKFIIWVLIVPFSWFFVQFILSLSAILTVWVLTLPYDSFQWSDLFEEALKNEELAGKRICKDIVISFNWDFSEIEGPWAQLGSEKNELDENIKCKSDDAKITIKELLTGIDQAGDDPQNGEGLHNSIFWVMSIYSYGILKIDQLDTINATQLTTIKTIADLVFKIGFDLLFVVVYLLLMIALLLALFVRWVRLWGYMMLSPVFGLLYFFWKGSEWFWESGKKFNIKEFIALALVPVYVSAALAFWLVFILVASEGLKKVATDAGEPNTLQAWGFSLTIIWAHGGDDDPLNAPTGNEEKSVIGKLIVEIFGIVILWIAVMAALGASETTKSIIEPIAKFGGSIWDLAAKAPTYAPIIPTGWWPGSWLSVTWLSSFWSKIEQSARWEAQSRWSTFADNFIPNSNSTSSQMQDMVTRSWVTSSSDHTDRVKFIKDVLDAHWKDLSTDARAREKLEAILKGLWVGVEISNVTDLSNLWKELHKWMSAANLPVTWNWIWWDTSNDLTSYLRKLSATTGDDTSEVTNNIEVRMTPGNDAMRTFVRGSQNAQVNKTEIFDGSWNVDTSKLWNLAVVFDKDIVPNAKAISELQDGGFTEEEAKAILIALGRADIT
jgi:hypothetical protein